MSIVSLFILGVFAIVVWFLWGMLSTFLRARGIVHLDDKVKNTTRGLHNLASKSDENICRTVIEKVDLQNLWGKVRARVIVSPKTSGNLVSNFVILLSEIENITTRVVHFDTVVNLGGWDVSIYQEFSDALRASLAAIDQLLMDINKELS